MTDKKTKEGKFFLIFGAITILSGLYLSIKGDYLIGISGSLVGALIIYQNMSAVKNNKSDSE